MTDPDKKTLEEILFFCSRGRFESSKKVDAEGLEKELSEKKAQGFTGVLCLTTTNGDKMSSDWIILDNGDVKQVIFEENVKEKGSDKRVVDFTPKGGFLETFSLSDVQMEEITRAAEPEKKVAVEEKVLAEAEIKEERAPKVKVWEAPPKDRGQREAERLDREEIMKKYHLKEPTEAYVEGLLKGFREPTRGDMIRCKLVADKVRKNLEEMFGEKMGQQMFEKQFKDLKIEQEYMTPQDLGKILESFQQNILEKIVGPENAEKAIQKLKREILPKVSQ